MTSTTLAMPDGATLEASTAAIKQLVLFQQQIPHWEAAECFRFVKSEKLFNEWAKLQENAATILRELEITKAHLFRRLGVLNQFDDRRMSQFSQRRCRMLAEMSDKEFQSFCSSLTHTNKLESELKKRFEFRQRWSAEEDAASRVFQGDNIAVADPVPHQRELRAAASKILESALANDERFTTSEIIQRISNTLGSDLILEGVSYAGMGTLIKKALDNESFEVDSIDGTLPCVVTYLDEEGWVRVPIHKAKLKQFKAMIDWREAQLSDFSRALDNLRAAYFLAYKACNGDMEATVRIVP